MAATTSGRRWPTGLAMRATLGPEPLAVKCMAVLCLARPPGPPPAPATPAGPKRSGAGPWWCWVCSGSAASAQGGTTRVAIESCRCGRMQAGMVRIVAR